jgi:hypothetical protein
VSLCLFAFQTEFKSFIPFHIADAISGACGIVFSGLPCIKLIMLRICALLAEITQNSTYTQAAQQSANFILSRVYTDDSLFLWQVAMNDKTCQIVTDEMRDSWNAGYAVEGLAVLSSIWTNETVKERYAEGFVL